MDIVSYNIGALLIFYLIYLVIGIALGIKVNDNLFSYEPIVEKNCENISYDLNTRNIRAYHREIALFFGIMWPIILVFFLSLDLGNTVYRGLIYNGNEEDRIASWLV